MSTAETWLHSSETNVYMNQRFHPLGHGGPILYRWIVSHIVVVLLLFYAHPKHSYMFMLKQSVNLTTLFLITDTALLDLAKGEYVVGIEPGTSGSWVTGSTGCATWPGLSSIISHLLFSRLFSPLPPPPPPPIKGRRRTSWHSWRHNFIKSGVTLLNHQPIK